MKRKAKSLPEPLTFICGAPITPVPCARCLRAFRSGKLRGECIMPLPEGAFAPRAQDRSGSCCFDCASADTLTRMGIADWEAARVSVANDRQEDLRLPDSHRPMFGLRLNRIVQASVGSKALERHQAWLDAYVPDWMDDPNEKAN